jgi:hypothetical protein
MGGMCWVMKTGCVAPWALHLLKVAVSACGPPVELPIAIAAISP